MLNDQQILTDIHSLSPEKQLKVLQYIRNLKQDEKGSESGKALRPFGVIPGKSHLSEDFNEPLADFQEYMP